MSISNIMFQSTTKLGQHHEVQEILGAGAYGDVTKCLNVRTQELEAVKVVKTCHDCVASARHEIEILQYLRCWDPEACSIIRFNSFFFHKEMICLSFELLDCDLRDYILERRNVSGESFLLTEVKPMIYQLATALECLQSAGVIHGDLKPENIMVVDRDQQPPKLKLVDFGGAHLSSNADADTIVYTPSYSPPEVLIGGKYNEAVDIWALGMVAVELVIGSRLYLGEDEYDVLKGIIATQGQPPDHILNLGEFTSTCFHRKEGSNPGWILKTPEEYEEETGYRSDNRCNTLDFLEEILLYETNDDIELFVDLVKGMLELDSFKRFTPQQVLQHPFFACSIPQSIPPTQVCFEDKPVEEPGVIQKPSCSQNRWQDDCLEVPIASLPSADDNLEVVQLESPGNTQLFNPGEVHVEKTTDIQLEIPSEVHVETTADVQLEIPSEVHMETTADVQLEIPSEVHVETITDVQLKIPSEVHVETTTDVRLEIPSEVHAETITDVQLEIPSEVHVETITDVQLEIPSEFHVETTTDVQLEIPSEVHMGTTTDVQPEISVDVQPNNNAHSRGCFARLIRWWQGWQKSRQHKSKCQRKTQKHKDSYSKHVKR